MITTDKVYLIVFNFLFPLEKVVHHIFKEEQIHNENTHVQATGCYNTGECLQADRC